MSAPPGSTDPEARLSALADAYPDPVIVVGSDSVVAYANRMAEQLLGYAPGAASGLSFDLIANVQVPDASASSGARRFDPGVEHGTGRLQGLAIRADGRRLPIEVSIAPVTTRAGVFDVVVVRERPEEPLPECLKMLEKVPDATVVTRADGVITFANPQMQDLFGYSREALLGKSIEMLVPDRSRGRHADHRSAYFAAPRTRPMGAAMPLFGRRADGSEFPVEISLSPLVTDGGTLAIASIRDLTDRKRVEEHQARLAKAEESLRLRDEFISTASHELRTPLTSLQLRVDASRRLGPKLPDAIRNDPAVANILTKLEGIDASTRRIGILVTNLLDISRITSGKLELEREPSDLSAIARSVVNQSLGEAESAGADIQFSASAGVTGDWDQARLEQVVANLISNAIKYGSRQPIEVSVTLPNDDTARIAVRDHGIGIAVADQLRVFQRFERAVSLANYPGFGLGLWVVQRIVEAHGGHIRVESAPGTGATFTVDLPRRQATP